uniref:Ribosomal RNA-processing protein 4 n=1 Tax=Syphacia muris TaxID=451379 RepID=A0A0N5A9M4_9BILA
MFGWSEAWFLLNFVNCRGHGTYFDGSQLIASVAGAVFQVNKLISVQPIKSRYNGEIGDVVIGRIVEVQQKRWKVDTNSRLYSTLMLSSVNLPGGELRRKSVEDELMMREYLKEGDLISAEVQKVSADGQMQLHTRNLRYGKLSQGTFIKVLPYLIKRRKSHFHTMPHGASIILGRNGYIWVSTVISEEEGLTGGYAQNLDEVVPLETRTVIARYTNCINLLAKHQISLYDTSIILAYEASLGYEVKDLLKSDVTSEIAYEVQQQLLKKMAEAHVVVSKNDSELRCNIASVLMDVIRNALKERGRAIIGLSGGSMPKILTPIIMGETSVDWNLVKFFAVDERLVPLNDGDSNTGAYLKLLPKQFANSFIQCGPIEDGIQCAKNYASALIDLQPPMLNGIPRFDILLLGHGPDGHTCSLFPNHRLLRVREFRLLVNTTDLVVYVNDSPKPPLRRITITLPVVCNARNIAFISTGEGKADIVKSILKDHDKSLPSVLAKPTSGELYWFLDTSSAMKL